MLICCHAAGTLCDALRCSAPDCLSEDRVTFYAGQIVLALDHIHRMGLIYRDLKPANVLLCSDGYVKLTDLGGVVDVGGSVLGEDFFAQETTLFSKDLPSQQQTVEKFLSKSKGSTETKTAFKESSKHHLSPVDVSVPSPHNTSADGVAPAAPASLKRATSIMGTAGYMAPEVSELFCALTVFFD
jgi:serine/threonine protein kinase